MAIWPLQGFSQPSRCIFPSNLLSAQPQPRNREPGSVGYGDAKFEQQATQKKHMFFRVLYNEPILEVNGRLIAAAKWRWFLLQASGTLINLTGQTDGWEFAEVCPSSSQLSAGRILYLKPDLRSKWPDKPCILTPGAPQNNPLLSSWKFQPKL